MDLAAIEGPKRYHLRRNGKPGYGEVVVEACWADDETKALMRDADLSIYSHLAASGDRLLYMSVIECRGLKDFDLFSANDVYCMVRRKILRSFSVSWSLRVVLVVDSEAKLTHCRRRSVFPSCRASRS